MLKLWSSDYAALVLARAILHREPQVVLQVYLGSDQPKGSICLSGYLPDLIKLATKDFSSVAIVSDILNETEVSQGLVSIQTELLEQFGNRGLADTVEFRRLARKYLRSIRKANCTAALFTSGILAEEKTQKIISQILGTQIKPLFLTDYLPEELFKKSDKQSIEIFTTGDLDRVHAEAEKFLHTKLAKNAVIKIC